MTVLLVAGLAAGQVPAQQTNKPGETQRPAPGQQKAPTESNPFPGDTNNVPLMPNGNAPAAPETRGEATPSALPSAEADPVRSPDDPVGDVSTDASEFSSSAAGLDKLMPPPDNETDTKHGKKGRAPAPVEHKETAAENEKVGEYYLSEKNWKAALSRYESAVVLDPENPEVYWGLGEARRHLGKLAEAKAAYETLVEYDPDSKHGKEAKKILKSPEMMNAPATASKQP